MAITSIELLRSQRESAQTVLSSQEIRSLHRLSKRLTSKQQGIFSQALAREEARVPFNSELMAMATEMRRFARRARDCEN